MTRPQNLETLRAHPVIREAAERMAKRCADAEIAAMAEDEPSLLDYVWLRDEYKVRAHLALLLSGDEASRDALVRIGIANDGRWAVEKWTGAWLVIRFKTLQRRYRTRPYLRGVPDFAATEEKASEYMKQHINAHWHALREDFPALVAALVAVIDG